MYYRYKQTGSVNCTQNVKRRMLTCIFERFEAALAASDGSEFKYSIMQDVLDAPAPSFFISPESAYLMFYKALHYKRSLRK